MKIRRDLRDLTDLRDLLRSLGFDADSMPAYQLEVLLELWNNPKKRVMVDVHRIGAEERRRWLEAWETLAIYGGREVVRISADSLPDKIVGKTITGVFTDDPEGV